MIDDAIFRLVASLAVVWFFLMLWAYAKENLSSVRWPDDADFGEISAALDDGRFEDGEFFLRASLDPHLAECRWEQFIAWLQREKQ